MRRIIASLSFLAVFLATPYARAELWTISLLGTALAPTETPTGFTVGEQIGSYTWDPAQLTWVTPFRVEGPVTATYVGLFNGVEDGLLAAFMVPGDPPVVQLIKDAVSASGTPLTPSFFTNPQPLIVVRNASQLFHNGSEYGWGTRTSTVTPVFVTVAQGEVAPLPESGTMALFASSLLSVLLWRCRTRRS